MIHKVSSRWKVIIGSLWYNWNGKIKKKNICLKQTTAMILSFFKPFVVIFIAYHFFSEGKYDDIKDTTLCLLFSLICLLKTLLICFIIVIILMLVRPACEKGYSGTNCSMKCLFPAYGQNCLSKCNCSINDCDHRNGCNRTKGGN